MSDYDTDVRFMAASDLCNLILNQKTIDVKNQELVSNCFFKQLNDSSHDVQANAVKCLSEIIPFLSVANVKSTFSLLGKELLNLEGGIRDVYATCISGLIHKLGSSHGAFLCETLIQTLIEGLNSDSELHEECVQLIYELYHFFPTNPSLITSSLAIIPILINFLTSNSSLSTASEISSSLTKKTINAMGAVSVTLPAAELEKTVALLINEANTANKNLSGSPRTTGRVRSSTVNVQTFSLLCALSSIVRSLGVNKGFQSTESIGGLNVLLPQLMNCFVSQLKLISTNDESSDTSAVILIEHALNAIQSLVELTNGNALLVLPPIEGGEDTNSIGSFLNVLVTCHLVYDPLSFDDDDENYVDQDDEDVDFVDGASEFAFESGSDLGNFDDHDDKSLQQQSNDPKNKSVTKFTQKLLQLDDSDTSWRVRRSASKLLLAILYLVTNSGSHRDEIDAPVKEDLLRLTPRILMRLTKEVTFHSLSSLLELVTLITLKTARAIFTPDNANVLNAILNLSLLLVLPPKKAGPTHSPDAAKSAANLLLAICSSVEASQVLLNHANQLSESLVETSSCNEHSLAVRTAALQSLINLVTVQEAHIRELYSPLISDQIISKCISTCQNFPVRLLANFIQLFEALAVSVSEHQPEFVRILSKAVRGDLSADSDVRAAANASAMLVLPRLTSKSNVELLASAAIDRAHSSVDSLASANALKVLTVGLASNPLVAELLSANSLPVSPLLSVLSRHAGDRLAISRDASFACLAAISKLGLWQNLFVGEFAKEQLMDKWMQSSPLFSESNLAKTSSHSLQSTDDVKRQLSILTSVLQQANFASSDVLSPANCVKISNFILDLARVLPPNFADEVSLEIIHISSTCALSNGEKVRIVNEASKLANNSRFAAACSGAFSAATAAPIPKISNSANNCIAQGFYFAVSPVSSGISYLIEAALKQSDDLKSAFPLSLSVVACMHTPTLHEVKEKLIDVHLNDVSKLSDVNWILSRGLSVACQSVQLISNSTCVKKENEISVTEESLNLLKQLLLGQQLQVNHLNTALQRKLSTCIFDLASYLFIINPKSILSTISSVSISSNDSKNEQNPSSASVALQAAALNGLRGALASITSPRHIFHVDVLQDLCNNIREGFKLSAFAVEKSEVSLWLHLQRLSLVFLLISTYNAVNGKILVESSMGNSHQSWKLFRDTVVHAIQSSLNDFAVPLATPVVELQNVIEVGALKQITDFGFPVRKTLASLIEMVSEFLISQEDFDINKRVFDFDLSEVLKILICDPTLEIQRVAVRSFIFILSVSTKLKSSAPASAFLAANSSCENLLALISTLKTALTKKSDEALTTTNKSNEGETVHEGDDIIAVYGLLQEAVAKVGALNVV